MTQRVITDGSKYAYLLSWVKKLKPGEAHQANLGHHFTCLVTSFSAAVYAAAATKGWKATVVTFPDEGCVVFAFYKPDDLMKPNLAAYPVVKKMRRF